MQHDVSPLPWRGPPEPEPESHGAARPWIAPAEREPSHPSSLTDV